MSNLPIPNNSSKSGWPYHLEDSSGMQYLRIRDGNLVSVQPMIGNDCLYLLLDDDGEPYADPAKDSMYTPALGSTQYNVTMNGSAWTTNEQLENSGCPTWEIPDEDDIPPEGRGKR